MGIDFEKLWQHAIAQFRVPGHSIHGPDHWRRVECNGLLLAKRTGADVDVVRLFAVLHDSQREDDCYDEFHGPRAAEFAASLHGVMFDLPQELFDILHYACQWHTNGQTHQDATIGTCWDADRLDLGRAGIIPSPQYMSTEFGREIAGTGSIQPFLQDEGVTAY